MKTHSISLSVAVACTISSLVLVSASRAEGPFRNRDNPDQKDDGEGTYPVPYQKPTVAEITTQLVRIAGFLENAMPTRVVERASGKEITDFSTPREDAVASFGEGNGFNPISYSSGVTHAGLLYAGEVTGDARFAAITARHMKFIAERLPYFRAQADKFGTRTNSFRAILATESLDDSGALCAAMIKARLAHVGAELRPVIDGYMNYISKKQFRLEDGTLARQRPQPESVWADDAYMSIPALAQMFRLTGERAWIDEAAKQLVQFADHLFDDQRGLYTHGRNLNQPDNPQFIWGRANGWVAMATCELLDAMPEDHPARARVLELLHTHVKALAELQSGSGLWHQMLDKPDSYLETSATAMFVYTIAHAINRGWISPVSYGSVAQAGWAALSTRITDRGEVEGSCVGTTFASDLVYYYNRPVSSHHGHGYGPMLLAGAEMIRLMQNPRFEIRLQFRTYHYIPKSG